MKHRYVIDKTARSAASAAKVKKKNALPLSEGIQRLDGDIKKIFVKLCKKHNSNMEAVWTELHAYLRKEGKTKTIRALKEAADRMSVMSVKDAIKVMEGMGLDTRNGIDVMVKIRIDGENFAIRMPNPHSGRDTTLKNRNYATRIICAAIGVKGNEAFRYLQKRVGNKATKGLFRKAASELAAI